MFKREIYELIGNEYEVIGEYITTNHNITLKHNKCGFIFDMLPSNFLKGQRCPSCALEIRAGKRRRTTEQFVLEVYHLVGEEYTVLGEYTNSQSPITMKHDVCGYVYNVIPNNFINHGHRCRKCAGLIPKTIEDFKKEVFELEKDNYTVLGNYVNTDTKIEIKHNKCGNIYAVTRWHFLEGKRCPRCKASKGETAIAKWLDEHKIKNNHQHKIDECKNINPLPFDFAVFLKDKPLILIEYQGEQHYIPIDFMGGEEGLEQRKVNDAIKKRYCKENNIALIEIPYWEFERIDEILTKELDMTR
ncbi:hypothetical protein A9490_13680 [Bacillus thuringiensis]|nr:hypothetical protein A9490_13680 [Bacillus thuringiensis]